MKTQALIQAQRQKKIQQENLSKEEEATAPVTGGSLEEPRKIAPVFYIAMQEQQHVGQDLKLSDEERFERQSRQITIEKKVEAGMSLSDAMAEVDGTPKASDNVVSLIAHARKRDGQQQAQSGAPHAQMS